MGMVYVCEEGWGGSESSGTSISIATAVCTFNASDIIGGQIKLIR